ncbi:MAG: pantoate--beta-alanine ligase [Pirellulaceae bacterium]
MTFGTKVEARTAPEVINDIPALRRAFGAARQQGGRIGLVPTMGALHEGHLSLVRAARADCDHVAVTIFVNPTQFGPREDLNQYPRTLVADLELLAGEGVELVFAPDVGAMYPDGFSTYLEPPSVAAPWEGVHRPGHFRGVATIVLKLFHLLPADIAYFGQKDYQQCQVIRQMVSDLDVPMEVRVCPTIREPDGLALSSRNRYLRSDEREQALALVRALRAGQHAIASGERQAAQVERQMQDVLTEAGIQRIDYAAVADPDTLAHVTTIAGPVVLLIAAFVGQTRLIDNLMT